MYELEEHLPHVAAQIDDLPRRAWNDDEAALVIVLTRPFDADLVDDSAPGSSARLCEDVSFTRLAGDRS
jgi:hypothetical protein